MAHMGVLTGLAVDRRVSVNRRDTAGTECES